jgi:hypothetical protein
MELENIILEQIMEESIQILEKDFYDKTFQFSYSSLNKLMWNPQAFYQMYILGNREEKTESYLVNGKIIHCLLLEPEKFDEQFIISPSNLPTGNTRTVVDRVYAHHVELANNGDQRTNLVEFTDAMLDVLKDINLHQSLKTDQQRIDKVFTPEAVEYWNYLRTKGNKTLIDQENYDFCKTGVELIKMDSKICNLIGCNLNDFSNKEVFNELPVDITINDRPFGLKGIIDNVVVDHDSRVIYINDIKTTSKELKDFPESIEFYNYWMQAAIYSTIIAIKFLHLIDGGYQMKFHFVVIDKNYQVYPFPVSEVTLNSWFDRLSQALQKAEWHYINKNYELPYEYANGLVVL